MAMACWTWPWLMPTWRPVRRWWCLVSQRDGVPVVEGRYPLPGVGSEVLAGDVNGDGATDLVVLGRSVEGGDGGAFVFLNQGVPAATAIAAETASTPYGLCPWCQLPQSVQSGHDDPRIGGWLALAMWI